MNKIFVKVKVPRISQEYEMFIPINKEVGKIIPLLQKAIVEINMNSIEPKENIMLIKADTNQILDPNVLVCDANIKQGDILVLL